MATIYLPKDAHPRERFAMDLQYVRNPSVLRDVRLVLLSLWISLRGKWETRGKKI
jgi:lipopolysaccharide/colanic/teichoic acid biosynthesis glycosyltransferase